LPATEVQLEVQVDDDVEHARRLALVFELAKERNRDDRPVENLGKESDSVGPGALGGAPGRPIALLRASRSHGYVLFF
jgi:hypothetical protein